MGKSKLEEAYFSMEGAKIFRDPVHGTDILLYPYEVRVINTRAFQRLRGIKQLGACELVWHGATHNRFQHSLGTLHMLTRMLKKLDPDQTSLSQPKRVVARLFALLHDIGHVPFGHTIEDERPAIGEHHTGRERVSAMMADEISRILKEVEALMTDDEPNEAGIGLTVRRNKVEDLPSLLVELVCECKGETDEGTSEVPPELKLYLDLIGNTICADLFDYLKRDTYYTGLQRSYDPRIMDSLLIWDDDSDPKRAVERRVAIDITTDKAGRSGARSELLHLLDVRYTLAERVYFNSTKQYASAMISKAFELSGLTERNLLDKRDDELLWTLENLDAAAQRAKPKKTGTPLETTRISTVLNHNAARLWRAAWRRYPNDAPDPVGSRELVQAYRRRSVFRPVYSVVSNETSERSLFKDYFHQYDRAPFRRAVESFLADLFALQHWQIIIYCPNPDMNLKFVECLAGPFEGRAAQFQPLDRLPETDHLLIGRIKERAQALRRDHRQLWRFDLLVPESLDHSLREDIGGCCKDLFCLDNNVREFRGAQNNIEIIRRRNATEALYDKPGRNPSEEHVTALVEQRTKEGVTAYTKQEFAALEVPEEAKNGSAE